MKETVVTHKLHSIWPNSISVESGSGIDHTWSAKAPFMQMLPIWKQALTRQYPNMAHIEFTFRHPGFAAEPAFCSRL